MRNISRELISPFTFKKGKRLTVDEILSKSENINEGTKICIFLHIYISMHTRQIVGGVKVNFEV